MTLQVKISPIKTIICHKEFLKIQINQKKRKQKIKFQRKFKLFRKISKIIRINLFKEKKQNKNHPIEQKENNCQFRIDLNNIIGGSPTNIRRSELITLEKLNKEKVIQKVFPDKKNTVKAENLSKYSNDEDRFFDFKRGNKESICESFGKISK